MGPEPAPGPRPDTLQVWTRVHGELGSVPTVPGTHPAARISHFTVYGGSYYSYVYARCLSSALWARLLEADPLDPAAGGWGRWQGVDGSRLPACRPLPLALCPWQ
jgi:intermediate peptidase